MFKLISVIGYIVYYNSFSFNSDCNCTKIEINQMFVSEINNINMPNNTFKIEVLFGGK